MKKNFVGAGFAAVLLAIFMLAIFTVVITACNGATTDASATATARASSSTNIVYMGDDKFDQPSITIKKGERITLVNRSKQNPHIIYNGTWYNGDESRPKQEVDAPTVTNVTINAEESSPPIGPFNTAGTFQLYCTIHTGMNLTVTVQ